MRGNLYVSLSGQVALEKRLETVAANIANVNTGGYRAQGVAFSSVLSKVQDRPASFVTTGSEYISRAQGPTTKTDNPLDVAIQGEGFLAIKTPAGTAFTRDGRMQITEAGELQTLNGYPVLDAGQASVRLDPNDGPPVITADGMMTQNGRQVGAIGLFSIPDNAKFTRYDNSAIVPNVAPSAILDFASNGFLQGFTEGSNVNPVMEITKLIQIQRAYDGLSNTMQSSETAQQDAVKNAGRHLLSLALAELERLAGLTAQLAAPDFLLRIGGTVAEVAPSFYRVRGLSAFARLGDCVALDGAGSQRHGEIVRIDPDGVVVKPFAATQDVGLGSTVLKTDRVTVAPTPSWKGRIIDALGEPIDGKGPLQAGPRRLPIQAEPPPALDRGRVKQPLKSGVRAIDIFTPLCHGQRIGIFAGSGVGKSTLLGMLAASKGFDTVVIALVGERGREVREFIEDSLGANRPLAVTVVATGDESATMRKMAPLTAMTVAEYFRDRGERVLLMVDSVTRYAHAARDVALAAGEPAVARGYAPSVFTDLPRILERAGPGARSGAEVEGKAGSITGIFAVLVDGDDHNDPVADCIRGTLDGHIVLDRAIADAGRYPAINVLGSISRLAHHVWSPEQRTLVIKLRAMVARFEDTRDLRLMGGLQAGADPDLDQAVTLTPIIYEALTQRPNAPASTDAFRELAETLSRTRA